MLKSGQVIEYSGRPYRVVYATEDRAYCVPLGRPGKEAREEPDNGSSTTGPINISPNSTVKILEDL